MTTFLAVNVQKNIRPYRLLDVGRGIAAFWVVMIHSCVPVIASESPQLARVPVYAFSLWGQLGVMMFFVISGYCITASAIGTLKHPHFLTRFLMARVRRIYPPYLASSVLAMLLGTVFTVLASHHFIPPIHHQTHFWGQSLRFYVAALTLTQIPLHAATLNIVFWSLCYEVAFYVLVAVFLWAFGRKAQGSFLLSLNVLTIISLLWLVLSPLSCPFPLNLWPQFGMGALVFTLLAYPEKRLWKGVCAMIFALAIVFAVVHQGLYSLGHPSSRIQTFFCIGFAVMLLFLYQYDEVLSRQRFAKLFAWLGTFSYSIYLTHALILPVPQQIAKRLGFQGSTYWVSFLAQIIVALGFSYVFYLFCERPFLSTRAKVREETETPFASSPAAFQPEPTGS